MGQIAEADAGRLRFESGARLGQEELRRRYPISIRAAAAYYYLVLVIGLFILNALTPYLRVIYTILKWAKKKAGRPAEDPHLPPLRRAGESQATNNNDEKAKILTERFFP
jgi:hypothetical protein